MALDTTKYPGFLKHLVVGLLSNGLALGGFVWAVSGAWAQQKDQVRDNTEAIAEHAEAPDVHATIESERAEARWREKIEQQQKAISDNVKEIKEHLLRRTP